MALLSAKHRSLHIHSVGVANLYERFSIGYLRSWATSECLKQIKGDDQFTNCISIGPVSTCMHGKIVCAYRKLFICKMSAIDRLVHRTYVLIYPVSLLSKVGNEVCHHSITVTLNFQC